MQNAQKGFTLIELVVVVVLLGILGVTALARFQDLSLDAQNAANSGIASEMSSGSSINYGAQALGSGGTAITGVAETCAAAATTTLATGLPTGYQLGGGPANCTLVASFTCTVDNTANLLDTPATATILCTI